MLLDGGSIPPISTNRARLSFLKSKASIHITIIQGYRVNNEIRAGQLRVIDENGENLGVMSKEEALQRATERGVDCVEIAPAASPPVAKLISFDKFRYQKEKELKKQRAAQKSTELKQVQVSARAAKNDLLIKAQQAKKFLEEGHRVSIVLVLRGREKGKKQWAEEKLKEFLALIQGEYKTIAEPRFAGRGIMMHIERHVQ